jgi:ABC-type Mn2+/Zn2+ transport system permease subunit
MRNQKGMLTVFIPVILTVCLYVVFFSRIETKPTDAGFWFIFAMGMSFGVALTRIVQWSKSDKKED